MGLGSDLCMMTSLTLGFHLNLEFPLGLSDRVSCNARVISAVFNCRISDDVAILVDIFVKFH